MDLNTAKKIDIFLKIERNTEQQNSNQWKQMWFAHLAAAKCPPGLGCVVWPTFQLPEVEFGENGGTILLKICELINNQSNYLRLATVAGDAGLMSKEGKPARQKPATPEPVITSLQCTITQLLRFSAELHQKHSRTNVWGKPVWIQLLLRWGDTLSDSWSKRCTLQLEKRPEGDSGRTSKYFWHAPFGFCTKPLIGSLPTQRKFAEKYPDYRYLLPSSGSCSQEPE